MNEWMNDLCENSQLIVKVVGHSLA